MKFTQEALGVILAVCSALSVSTTVAFSSVATTNVQSGQRAALSAPSFGISSSRHAVGFRVRSSVPGSSVLRKLAENDDDDDDFDEPLSKGVDSVSWLPTVVAAKSVETTSSAGDVSTSDYIFFDELEERREIF